MEKYDVFKLSSNFKNDSAELWASSALVDRPINRSGGNRSNVNLSLGFNADPMERDVLC